MEAIDIVWVGIGGGIGSVLRWQIGRVVDRHIASTFKVGTFVINISGAFVIAYISTLLTIGWEQRYDGVIASLVLTGTLGGYTTFSTMQLDAVQMASARHHAMALVYLATSVVGGLLAALAGFSLASA